MTAQKIQNDALTGELITVDRRPATITLNFEEAKSDLEARIARYNVVVTIDTLADAKKMATEINRIKLDIGKREKAAVDFVSAPIVTFKDEMKELKRICEDGRQGILTQVAKFEQETLNTAEKLLGEFRDALRKELGIDAEYHKAEIGYLIKITALTTKGNLTKTAKDTLTQLVRDEKYQQERVEKRLLMLENASYRAGLKSPLTRHHVESFLFLSDDEYAERLDLMLESEKQREEQAAAAHRRDFEEEQKRKEAEAQQQAEAKQQASEPSEADRLRQKMQDLRRGDMFDEARDVEVQLSRIEPVDPERVAQINEGIQRNWQVANDVNQSKMSRQTAAKMARIMTQHLTDLGGTLDQPEPVEAVSNVTPLRRQASVTASPADHQDAVAPTTVAPLHDKASGQTAPATLSQGEAHAIKVGGTNGVWRHGVLVSIVHQGQVFRLVDTAGPAAA